MLKPKKLNEEKLKELLDAIKESLTEFNENLNDYEEETLEKKFKVVVIGTFIIKAKTKKEAAEYIGEEIGDTFEGDDFVTKESIVVKEADEIE